MNVALRAAGVYYHDGAYCHDGVYCHDDVVSGEWPYDLRLQMGLKIELSKLLENELPGDL